MPELPEAEVARKSLTPCVAGKTIREVLVGRRQSIRTPLQDDVTFALALRRRTIKSIERQAKALVFHLDDGSALIFHFKLGASVRCGNERLADTGGVALNFTDGSSLEFADLALSEFHVAASEDLARLPVLKEGADPLSRSLTAAKLRKLLPKNRQIKAALTDQETIGGIGNTYSDEILWNARISPFRKVSDLTGAQWDELTRQIKATLREGIRDGGEEGFTDARGRHGCYHTRVHKREGEPCPRDGHPIEMVKKGRKTFWCPQCQV
ncbi:MAG: Fpg/Nei family DNA glycosylase [Thermoleophilia bacterium]|nr:Fpg/Nei family DNA glycosylase [Thermoleophilia bacterium]